MVELVRGRGSLAETFSGIEGSRWAVLGGRTSFEASGAREMLEPFLDSGARVLLVEGPLPDVEEVDRLTKELSGDPPTSLLGVGGGLVIDTMKMVAACLRMGATASQVVDGIRLSDRRDIRMVAAPTTAGSGAERTPFAVAYRDGVKHSVDDARLLPASAILDPLLAGSVPPRVAGASGLDAIAHCVESMWACRSTLESRSVASAALASLAEHIEPAVVGRDEQALEALVYAASDAGEAIATTRTTAAHALSYHLTSEHGIAHGHAVALTLRPLLELNHRLDGSSVVDERGHEHVKETIVQMCAALGVSDAHEARHWLDGLIVRLGLESSVDEAAGRPVDRSRWLAGVNAQRLANNPYRLSDADLMEIANAA